MFFGGLVGLCFIISFSSCQREVDGVLTQDGIADSTYLDRMIFVDTTLPAGSDTTAKYLFKYDNSNRLISTIQFEIGGTDTIREEFFYIANDTLPYKQVYHNLDYSAGPLVYFVDTIFYNYTNQVVTKDSTIEWDLSTNSNYGVRVTEFSILPNKVVERSKQYDFVAGGYILFSDNSDTAIVTKQLGNVVFHIDPSPTFISQAQVTYDNKVNPYFKALKIHYPDFQFLNREGWDAQKNNPIHINFEHATGYIVDEIVSYIYRNDNYPLVANRKDVGNNSYYKIIYKYISL
jgi:hypothetical protein